MLRGEITGPRIQSEAAVILLASFAGERPVNKLRQLVSVFNLESIELRADAFQETRFTFDVKDTQASQSRIRHAGDKLALARSGSAAHGHHESLLSWSAAHR